MLIGHRVESWNVSKRKMIIRVALRKKGLALGGGCRRYSCPACFLSTIGLWDYTGTNFECEDVGYNSGNWVKASNVESRLARESIKGMPYWLYRMADRSVPLAKSEAFVRRSAQLYW